MALLQSVHVLKLANDTVPKGAGSTGIVYAINNNLIEHVTAATAQQTANYPGTASVIKVRSFKGNEVMTGDIYVTEAVAAIITAS